MDQGLVDISNHWEDRDQSIVGDVDSGFLLDRGDVSLLPFGTSPIDRL